MSRNNNNIIVPVPTEVKNIKSKLIFGLTKRQAIGFSLTIALAVPVFLLLKKVSLDLAMYSAFFVAVPLMFATLFEKDKLTAEEWIKNFLEHKVLFKEKRLYKITKKNKEIARKRGFLKNDK